LVVYVDLIFLINFLMDGTLLYTTAKIRKARFKWWRLLLSSAIGASYVVFMLVPDLSMLYTFLVKIAFSLAMLAVAFGIGSVRSFGRHLAVFYIVNFAAAGGIFGVRYLLASASDVMNGILFTHFGGMIGFAQLGIAFIAIVACGVLLLVRSVIAGAKERERLQAYVAELEVQVGEHTKTCTGLIDTGNQLYEPLTRTPVMIMEVKQWTGILPAAWISRIVAGEAEQLLLSLEEASGWEGRLRFVPYRSVNRSTQLMIAMRPDKIVVTLDGRRTETDRVLIGLDGGTLSREGAYQAIIHPAMLSEEMNA